MLVLLKFGQFSPESKELGVQAPEKVWIGNFNAKAWKTTEHKLYKIWRSLQCSKISGKQVHPCDGSRISQRVGTMRGGGGWKGCQSINCQKFCQQHAWKWKKSDREWAISPVRSINDFLRLYLNVLSYVISSNVLSVCSYSIVHFNIFVSQNVDLLLRKTKDKTTECEFFVLFLNRKFWSFSWRSVKTLSV